MRRRRTPAPRDTDPCGHRHGIHRSFENALLEIHVTAIMPCSESTRAAVVVLLLALAVCASAGNFDPWRTHVIDHGACARVWWPTARHDIAPFAASSCRAVGNNWMFRGNEPLNGTSFAYDQVVATFREVCVVLCDALM